MDQGMPVEAESERSLDWNINLLYAALCTAFGVCLLVMCVHLYTRWRWQARRRGVLYANQSFGEDRGLEPSVLSSLPIFRYSSKAAEQAPLECSVCLSEFGGDENVRLLPKCGHTFHVDCIGMWFYSHSTCPLCRSPVEAVVSQADPLPTAGMSIEEPSSSSRTQLCATCQHEEGSSSTASFWWRKVTGGEFRGIRMEPPPLRQADESGSSLTPCSPGSRLLSLKRMLSMNRKSTPQGAADTSRYVSAADLDLEKGLNDAGRAQNMNTFNGHDEL